MLTRMRLLREILIFFLSDIFTVYIFNVKCLLSTFVVDFSATFICQFVMDFYPFDTQRCEVDLYQFDELQALSTR
jgi:hypothetical protein